MLVEPPIFAKYIYRPNFIVFTMTTINIELDKALHKELKKKAIDDDISMVEGAIQGIKWYVNKDTEKAEALFK